MALSPLDLRRGQPESVGTLNTTLLVMTIHWPSVDIRSSGGETRIAYGIGPNAGALDGDAAPTAYWPIPDGEVITKTNPNSDGAMPWKLLFWKDSGTVTAYVQGVMPVRL